MNVEHVKGRKAGGVMLYALSTCGWCRKTKNLLDELGIAYDYVYVDLASSDERDEIEREMMRWNPSLSFPTLVINDDSCIVGFNEQGIRDSLGG
jgi:glutaredoxin